MLYQLVAMTGGKKITMVYHNFTIATDKLVELGSGKLYQGKKLVGEL